MAHSTRTRPLSASSCLSHNIDKNVPASGYVTDSSGTMGLEGGSKWDRPIPELLNLLLDTAHQRHDSRNGVHKATRAYNLFSRRAATSSGACSDPATGTGSSSGAPCATFYTMSGACGSTGSSSSIRGVSSRAEHIGSFSDPAGFSPVCADVSPLSLNPSGHSSTTVYAWGEVLPKGISRRLSSTSPATATTNVTSPAAASQAQPALPRAATGKVQVAQLLLPPGVRNLIDDQSRSPSPHSLPSPPHSPRSPLSPLRQVHGGTASLRTDPGSPLGLTPASRIHMGHNLQQIQQQQQQQMREVDVNDDGLRMRSGIGAGGSSATDWGPHRSPRSVVRSEVVARALAPWQGAELEVVCLYDCNFQSANCRSQHGVPLRVPPRKDIGLVSYLYRWYCKRATQFRSPPSASDISDAPIMPQTEEPWRASASAASAASTAVSTTIGGRDSATAHSSQSLTGDAGSGRAPLPAWLRKATTLRRHGGIPIIESGTHGGGGGADTGGCSTSSSSGSPFDMHSSSKAGTSSGRRLNCSSDPVMCLSELMQLLEDMEVVPQLATRTDVVRIFNAAAQAAANPATASAAADTAKPPAPAPHCSIAASSSSKQQSQQHTYSHPHRHTQSGHQSPSHTFGGKGSDPWVGSASLNAFSTGHGTQAAHIALEARNAATLLAGSRPRKAATPAAAVACNAAASRSNVIPRTQPHPEDIRFPVFKDILVRLSIAIANTERPPVPSNLAAAAATAAVSKASPSQVPQSSSAVMSRASTMTAEATAPGSPLVGEPSLGHAIYADAVGYPHARAGSATSNRSPQRSKRRILSMDNSVAAVRKFMERLQLYRGDVRALKNRLDELSRNSMDHAVRLRTNRALYINLPSAVEASQNVEVECGVIQPPPHVRQGIGVRPLPTWSVLAAVPAPPHLTAVLTEEDHGEDSRYQPAWREFGAVALDLGLLQPGELRKCRLLLHCRGPYTLDVRIDTSDAPFCYVTHVGLHSVPPGLPYRVDVTVQLHDIGEVRGGIRLRYRSSQECRERELVVPIYGTVCPAGEDGTVTRKVPATLSDRSLMAAKAVRERTLAEQMALAVPLVPPLRGPASTVPSIPSSSSSSLIGCSNSSATAAGPNNVRQACAGWVEAPAAAAALGKGRCGGSSSSGEGLPPAHVSTSDSPSGSTVDGNGSNPSCCCLKGGVHGSVPLPDPLTAAVAAVDVVEDDNCHDDDCNSLVGLDGAKHAGWASYQGTRVIHAEASLGGDGQ